MDSKTKLIVTVTAVVAGVVAVLSVALMDGFVGIGEEPEKMGFIELTIRNLDDVVVFFSITVDLDKGKCPPEAVSQAEIGPLETVADNSTVTWRGAETVTANVKAHYSVL